MFAGNGHYEKHQDFCEYNSMELILYGKQLGWFKIAGILVDTFEIGKNLHERNFTWKIA